jgi:hypothetical protein
LEWVAVVVAVQVRLRMIDGHVETDDMAATRESGSKIEPESESDAKKYSRTRPTAVHTFPNLGRVYGRGFSFSEVLGD